MKRARVLGLAVLFAAVALPAYAQTGRIQGSVTDSVTGQPINGAAVAVVGTQLVVTTQPNGLFSIADVPAGAHQVQVNQLGYGANTKTVTVQAGQSVRASRSHWRRRHCS